jgi:hypothetical protein
MEILCGSGLSVTTMVAAGFRSMRHNQSVDIISGGHGGSNRASRSDEMGSGFWQEVSSRYAQDDPVMTNAKNSQGWVLFEVFLILVVAGLLVVAANIWIPTS